MSTSRGSAAWEPADPSALEWILARGGDVGGTGFDVGGFADSAWVLHGMYARTGEDPMPPAARPAPRTQADRPPSTADWGRGPGPGYRRLRWQEFAGRVGTPLVPPGQYPDLRSLPKARNAQFDWPQGITWPFEGTLDLDSWLALTALLAQHSAEGCDTISVAYYPPWTNQIGPVGSADYLLRGRIGDAEDLVDHPQWRRTPQSLWAHDRTWFVFTDYDSWATRVSGSPALITDLLRSTAIEATRLPETPGPTLQPPVRATIRRGGRPLGDAITLR